LHLLAAAQRAAYIYVVYANVYAARCARCHAALDFVVVREKHCMLDSGAVIRLQEMDDPVCGNRIALTIDLKRRSR
jgi:hypothetical protein